MIRYAKLSDAKAIADIYNEYILHSVATFETEAVSEDEMYRRIADISSRFPYLVFEEGGQVIGYAYAHLWQEWLLIAIRGKQPSTSLLRLPARA